MASTKRYELFGGAIHIELPTSLVDASELRQVPDNQEVLLSSESDLSIIVEVLEKVAEGNAGSDPEDALRFHFSSLAHDNLAIDSTIISTTITPAPEPSASRATPSPWTLHGRQSVAKFNAPDTEADIVSIRMAVWRLDGIGNGGRGTDLVLTINIPEGKVSEISAPPLATNGNGGTPSATKAGEIFALAARSLTISDWGLFA